MSSEFYQLIHKVNDDYIYIIISPYQLLEISKIDNMFYFINDDYLKTRIELENKIYLNQGWELLEKVDIASLCSNALWA